MKKRWLCQASICAIVMLFLILDAKTALKGAQEGITVCLYTVIPSLFPLLLLSTLLNSMITGRKINFLKPLGRFCSVPSGAESILLLGLIGGYPVGAQCIYQAYSSGQLSRSDSRRMLGFCNNAGPAFIFGMSASLFSNSVMCWYIWAIHILSAIIVGVVLSGDEVGQPAVLASKTISFSEAINATARILISICSWVILFRITISILTRWLQFFCSNEAIVLIAGFLELSNGCISLNNVQSEAIRFIFLSGFLGFGGCCVVMQTVGAVKELGLGSYLPGKLIQCTISLVLAAFTVKTLMIDPNSLHVNLLSTVNLLALAFLLTAAFVLIRKKTVAFRKNVVYNRKKETNEV